MKNIKQMGKFKSEDQLINGSTLEEGAVPLKEAETASGMFIKGLLLFLPAAAVMAVLTVMRVISADMMPKKMSFGVIAVFMISMAVCFVLMTVHEYIHALLFPAEAEKQIWKHPEQNALFVYCTAKVSKNRFIAVCLAPAVILGIIPFIIWLLAASALPAALSWGLLIISWTMTLSAIGDYANSWNVLRQVPSNAMVFNHGMHTFYKA